MSSKDRVIKTVLFVFVIIYYLGGYAVINEMAARREVVYQLPLPFENHIPFMPWMIFGYMLIVVPLSLGYLLIQDLAFFKKIVRSFLVCVTVHFVIFTLFPVRYIFRPEMDPELNFISSLVSFYYWVDKPYNCFPSLHISNVFLIAFIMVKYRAGWGWIFQLIAMIVSVSVLVVKQHYIADVAGGFAMAYFVYRAVFVVKERSSAPVLMTGEIEKI